MNELDRIFTRTNTAEEFARGYLDHLADLLQSLDTAKIAAFIERLNTAREQGRMIFFVGNGGSAATASHFANDIAIGTRTPHKPFKAMSLCDNVPVMTAISNDDGYDEMFVQQLRLFLSPGDMVVAISASGNSPNVLRAVEYAKQNDATTVALSGFDGGKLSGLCDLCLHVSTEKGEYGPVEDIHMVLDHLIGAYLQRECRTKNC